LEGEEGGIELELGEFLFEVGEDDVDHVAEDFLVDEDAFHGGEVVGGEVVFDDGG